MRDIPLPGSGVARQGTGNADLQIMVAAHYAFRRDMATLARTATRQTLADLVRRVMLGAGWELFKRQLLLHHWAEDDSVWPVLRDRLAGHAAAPNRRRQCSQRSRLRWGSGIAPSGSPGTTR